MVQKSDLGLGGLDKFDHINRLITLSVILLSSTHCKCHRYQKRHYGKWRDGIKNADSPLTASTALMLISCPSLRTSDSSDVSDDPPPDVLKAPEKRSVHNSNILSEFRSRQ